MYNIKCAATVSYKLWAKGFNLHHHSGRARAISDSTPNSKGPVRRDSRSMFGRGVKSY